MRPSPNSRPTSPRGRSRRCAGLQGLVQRVLAAAEAEAGAPHAGLARQVLEGSPAGPARRTSGMRTSGLLSPTGSLRSREKMVWDWPDIADRLIEELR